MGRSEGKHQSCRGCEVYVLCNDAGFMRDDIPCEPENGKKTYFNPVLKSCTVKNSSLCRLRSVEQPYPGENHKAMLTLIARGPHLDVRI